MKKINRIFTILLLALFTLSLTSNAQSKFTAASNNVVINGTSTLHDWEMISKQSNIEAVFAGNGAISGLSSLTFTIPAESLKSGKGAMDKNAYKALKTGSSRNISYTATSATVSPSGNNTYVVKCNGKLTIAGTSRETDLIATCKINGDKSITVTGVKKLKMTDYKVEPPSFMFGSVTTGDDIAIKFNATLKN